MLFSRLDSLLAVVQQKKKQVKEQKICKSKEFNWKKNKFTFNSEELYKKKQIFIKWRAQKNTLGGFQALSC